MVTNRDWRPAAAWLRMVGKAVQAAARIKVGDLGDFGVHRGSDLLGDQPSRIPGEIAQQRSSKQRKQEQIDQR